MECMHFQCILYCEQTILKSHINIGIYHTDGVCFVQFKLRITYCMCGLRVGYNYKMQRVQSRTLCLFCVLQVRKQLLRS